MDGEINHTAQITYNMSLEAIIDCLFTFKNYLASEPITYASDIMVSYTDGETSMRSIVKSGFWEAGLMPCDPQSVLDRLDVIKAINRQSQNYSNNEQRPLLTAELWLPPVHLYLYIVQEA
jgi:hypothetical protein